MARIDKAKLTKAEIFMIASRLFMTNGYTNTTIRTISNELGMSTGNVTFYFPTKEHILAEFVETMCDFQGEMLDNEENEGYSSIMGICLELASMAVASELDEKMRDIFYSSYISPIALDIIRKNDTERAKRVFAEYCDGWSDEDYAQAELLVSGIEFVTFMPTDNSPGIESRIEGALRQILKIYNVPDDVIERKIKKVFSMDYQKNGKRIIRDFKKFVERVNEHTLEQIVHLA